MAEKHTHSSSCAKQTDCVSNLARWSVPESTTTLQIVFKEDTDIMHTSILVKRIKHGTVLGTIASHEYPGKFTCAPALQKPSILPSKQCQHLSDWTQYAIFFSGYCSSSTFYVMIVLYMFFLPWDPHIVTPTKEFVQTPVPWFRETFCGPYQLSWFAVEWARLQEML